MERSRSVRCCCFFPPRAGKAHLLWGCGGRAEVLSDKKETSLPASDCTLYTFSVQRILVAIKKSGLFWANPLRKPGT